ncbi:MAG TPA: DUF6210 family protein [Candidatus Angelobacter sp.]|nr:DUF6210 family protein [Candidatus Angelobacter sp.]
MENQSKPVISLDGFHGVGLIIARPSGVLYGNQAEGYACSHPQAEGVFLPLPVQPGASELWSLQQHFRGEWGPIDEESARIVDRILRRNGHNYLKVNRARLTESCEAWIHVLIDEPEMYSKASSAIAGFGKCEGVLTWPNSD